MNNAPSLLHNRALGEPRLESATAPAIQIQKPDVGKIVQKGIFLLPCAVIDRAMATKNALMGYFNKSGWLGR